MDRKTTTWGRAPERLARLLRIAVEADHEGQPTSKEAKAALLHARLAGTLPLDKSVVEALPAIVGHLCEELLPLRGEALGKVLLDRSTELDVLEIIKAYAKQLAKSNENEVDHAVSVAIYFAAIASALLYHDRKITSYSYPVLADALGKLIDEAWMAPELARHLAKARKCCEKEAR